LHTNSASSRKGKGIPATILSAQCQRRLLASSLQQYQQVVTSWNYTE